MKLYRPDDSFTDEKRAELRDFLMSHWRRARDARGDQIDNIYPALQQNYNAVPAEKERSVPFQKASNLVVPLIRTNIDTFVARTLNIVLATKPLYTVSGLPDEHRQAYLEYLNDKALHDWDHDKLAWQMLMRGNKYGTVIVKTTWEVSETMVPIEGAVPFDMRPQTTFQGPQSKAIAFEDYFCYPFEANDLSEVIIHFHKRRYPEEEARRIVESDDSPWKMTPDELENALKEPDDVKRDNDQWEAGVGEATGDAYRELEMVECHLEYPIKPGSNSYYRLVCELEPDGSVLANVYFNPYPPEVSVFQDYRPYPAEDLFWGTPMGYILAPFQEEASCIHNDRRNNAAIANGPQFKKKKGADVPNPASNSYLGKVWTLDDMDDLDVLNVGRNYPPGIDEENQVLMLAERVTGIGAAQQGQSQGSSGKRGVYNTGGVLGILSESNTRQNTNIRLFRMALSGVGRTAAILDSEFGPANDPALKRYPPEMQERIMAAREILKKDGSLRRAAFEIRASDAAENREIERANLLQIVGVLTQYAQTAVGMAKEYVSNKNPLMREIMMESIKMQRKLAAEAARKFGLLDMEDQIPDVGEAIEKQQQAQPQSQQQPSYPSGNDLRPSGGGTR